MAFNRIKCLLVVAFVTQVALGHSFNAAAGDRPIIARASVSSVDPNLGACVSVETIFASCVTATSSFVSLDITAQASCLCYTNSTWQPTVYDGFVESCAAYGSTVDKDVKSLSAICSSVGNVVASTTNTNSGGATSSGASGPAETASTRSEGAGIHVSPIAYPQGAPASLHLL